MQDVEDGQSLTQQRSHCTIVVWSWYQYQDDLPAALPSVPWLSEAAVALPTVPQPEGGSQTSFILQVSNIFKTSQNGFGLWWKYSTQNPPTYDPEKHITLEHMVNHGVQQDQDIAADFGLYPNENWYLLGQWYWNKGIQKSKGSFQDLLSIYCCLGLAWPVSIMCK